MIEKKTLDEAGKVKNETVCVLCADTFPSADVIKHVGNKIHMYQFIVSVFLHEQQ